MAHSLSSADDVGPNLSAKMRSCSGNTRSRIAVARFLRAVSSRTSSKRYRASCPSPSVASSPSAEGSKRLQRRRSAMGRASMPSVFAGRTVSTFRHASVWMGLMTATSKPLAARKSKSATQ